MSVQSNSNFNASGNSLLRNSEGNQCVFNDYVAPSSSDNSNHPSNSSTTSEESGGNSNPRSNSSTTSDEANFLSKTIENRPEVTINPSDLVKIDHVAKPCMFFAQGTCRNGSECRFSHRLIDSPSSPTNTLSSSGSPHRFSSGSLENLSKTSQLGAFPVISPPPPILINIPPGHPVFCIDVECVATGVNHNARSVAQVAIVDEWGRTVFNVFIKQDAPVLSYITELTGLRKEILDQYGLPMAEAMANLRAHLPPNAILVGQSILKDVQWLQLAEGVDYASLIDLSGLFRVWNSARGQYTNFSQDHCAKVWIGIENRPNHNAVTDAQISMSLFNAYRTVQWDPPSLFQMQQATLNAVRVPGFSAVHPVVDGCCMGNRKKCICGAPFL